MSERSKKARSSTLCPLCLSEDVGHAEKEARVKYKGRICAFVEPYLECRKCHHEFGDRETHELAAQRLREAAGVPAEITAEFVADIRKKLGLSRKLLEIALETSEKQTAAWEHGRKRISEPAQNVLRLIAADPTVPAKLLLCRKNVWTAFVNSITPTPGVLLALAGKLFSPSSSDPSDALCQAFWTSASLPSRFSRKDMTHKSRSSRVFVSWLDTRSSQCKPTHQLLRKLAHVYEDWDSKETALIEMRCELASKVTVLLVRPGDLDARRTRQLEVLSENLKRWQAEYRGSMEAVAQRLRRIEEHAHLRNALAHLHAHPRPHLQLVSGIVDTVGTQDIRALYTKSTGKNPELEFAHLFAEKLTASTGFVPSA